MDSYLRVAALLLSVLIAGAATWAYAMQLRRRITPSLIDKVVSAQTQHHDKNIIAQRVQIAWIDGVLKNNLINNTALGYNLNNKPILPKSTVMDTGVIIEESVSSQDKSIVDIYKNSGGSLLIIGEPGSGKTTSLLLIAQNLLDEFNLDNSKPVPVVFNLSSWNKDNNDLLSWFIEELNDMYQIPRNVSLNLINSNQLVLLLDELDGVEQEQISDCINSINIFRRQNGFSQIVVCSRPSDYIQANAKLNLSMIVDIKPLTQEQIAQYLHKSDVSGQALWNVIRNNKILSNIVRTPLMLRMLEISWRKEGAIGWDIADLKGRNKLFSAYTEHLFERKHLIEGSYSKQQTFQWLSWLATSMSQRGLAIFFLEELQPDWLSSPQQSRYFEIIVALTSGLLGAIIGALSSAFIMPIISADSQLQIQGITTSALALAVAASAYGGTSIAVIGYTAIITSTTLLVQTTNNRDILGYGGSASGVIIGIVIGFVITINRKLLYFRPINISTKELLIRIACGVLSGFVIATTVNMNRELLPMIDAATISLTATISFVAGLIIGLSTGGHVVLFGRDTKLLDLKTSSRGKPARSIESKDQLVWKWENGIIALLFFSFAFTLIFNIPTGLSVGVIASMFLGLNSKSDLKDEKITPNQAIQRTLQTAVLAAIIGLLVGVFTFLINYIYGVNDSLYIGLTVSILLASANIFIYGGQPLLQHYFLRLVLYRNNKIPIDFVNFLDFATDTGILRRVGSGYMFQHRFLLDYFADITEMEIINQQFDGSNIREVDIYDD